MWTSPYFTTGISVVFDSRNTSGFRSEGKFEMVSGESNGVGKVKKKKISAFREPEIGSDEYGLEARLLIDEIFGKELDSTSTSMECNMCGDVGLPEHLLHCSLCHERHEHSYCSSSHRETGLAGTSWVCDWCWPTLAPNCTRQSESDRLESSIQLEREELSRNSTASGPAPRVHNGLDILLEVLWGSSEFRDLACSPEMAKEDSRKDSSRRTVASAAVAAAPSTAVSPKAVSSPPKTSASGKKRQGSAPDRWSVTQKRACSSKNYGNVCARSGIQIERSNLAKGLGRRYRLLSSMLC